MVMKKRVRGGYLYMELNQSYVSHSYSFEYGFEREGGKS